MRPLSLLALLLAPLGVRAAPDYWDAELGIALATRLHGEDRLFQRSTQLLATLEDSWGEVYLKAKGRARYDFRYEGEHPYGEAAEEAYRHDADWRHLYLGMPLAEGELTLGWQQVVWGRADELRVLDQVNPVDYRWGGTALLDDSRIALPMLRYTRTSGDWEWEALAAGSRKNRAPEPGSEFDSPVFAAPDPAYFHALPPEDDRGLAYGLSANGRLGEIDASFVALSARQFDPVYASLGPDPDGRLAVRAEHPRYTMLGTGLAADLGNSLVLRGELAYFDRWRVANPSRETGSDETAQIKSLLGIDYLVREWLISGQWQGQRLLDWREGMLGARSEHVFTLSAEGSHAQDRLKSRFLLAFSPPAGDDAWLQGLFSYKPADWLKLGLEINVFFGTDTTMFGAYDRRDHLRLSAAYVF
ncbi:MAG: hypothetical protein HYV16_10760 [Gammaproteobacteria bacterium]|nr:hypothetical protein [Gammaproteobacteria bacterium]